MINPIFFPFLGFLSSIFHKKSDFLDSLGFLWCSVTTIMYYNALINLRDVHLSKIPFNDHEVNTAFEYLLEEYLNDNSDIGETLTQINFDSNKIESEFDAEFDTKVVAAFLENPCHGESKLSKTVESPRSH